MNPDLLIYKPRYSLRIRLVTFILPALFFALLCNAAFTMIRLPAVFWTLALLLGFLTSLVPFFIIREIRFLDEMVVRRHFLPDEFFSHKEIEQVGPTTILATGRRIRLGEVVNPDELKTSIQRWKATRLLKESKNPAQPMKLIYPQRGYGTYASFWGLVIGVIIMLMTPPWLALDPRWLLAGGFLAVYFIYIYLVPRIL